MGNLGRLAPCFFRVSRLTALKPVLFLLRHFPPRSHLRHNCSCEGRSMHIILFYDVVDDYVERRAQFRELHLKHARAAFDRGELLLGGALADPVDGAVLVFRGASSEAVEHFAQTDPYVVNGLVKQWRVRKWNTVIGEGASVV